tara:strand:- start:2918 stop:3157 length:240 start_codon:yes stop_codon:yes gene_type:complete
MNKELETNRGKIKEGYEVIIGRLKDLSDKIEGIEITSDMKLLMKIDKKYILSLIREYPDNQELGEQLRIYYNSLIYKND